MKAAELVIDEKIAELYDANQLFTGYAHFQNVGRALEMLKKYENMSEEARILCKMFEGVSEPGITPPGIGINIPNAADIILEKLDTLETLKEKEIARYYSLTVSWVFERAVPVSVAGGLFDMDFMTEWCKKVKMTNGECIERLIDYSQSNRDFLYHLGNGLWGVSRDLIRIILLEASKMGCTRSMFRYAQNVFLATDPEFYKWMAMIFRRYAAPTELLNLVLNDCFGKVSYASTSGPDVKYYAGRFIFNVNPERFVIKNEIALELKTLYRSWSLAAREAVDMWTLAVIHYRTVPKDIRIMISKMIWDFRSCWGERDYEERKLEMMEARAEKLRRKE